MCLDKHVDICYINLRTLKLALSGGNKRQFSSASPIFKFVRLVTCLYRGSILGLGKGGMKKSDSELEFGRQINVQNQLFSR